MTHWKRNILHERVYESIASASHAHRLLRHGEIRNFVVKSHETLIREPRQHPSGGLLLVPLVISDSKSSQGRILRR